MAQKSSRNAGGNWGGNDSLYGDEVGKARKKGRSTDAGRESCRSTIKSVARRVSRGEEYCPGTRPGKADRKESGMDIEGP